MDNIISLNHRKGGEIEFEMDVIGLDIKLAMPKFIINLVDYEILFNCEPSTDGKNFKVKIPALKAFEKTTYDFKIAIAIDGYYFEPYKGVINFVPDADVYIQVSKDDESNKKDKSPKKPTNTSSEKNNEAKEKASDKKDEVKSKKEENKKDEKKESFFFPNLKSKLDEKTNLDKNEPTKVDPIKEKLNNDIKEMLKSFKKS